MINTMIDPISPPGCLRKRRKLLIRPFRFVSFGIRQTGATLADHRGCENGHPASRIEYADLRPCREDLWRH
jgi:hypothetical protein